MLRLLFLFFLLFLFVRLLTSIIFKRPEKKYNQNNNYSRQRKEGDVTIENISGQSKNSSKNKSSGEYVDYEEL